MNKKIIAGAVIALAAGIATILYRRNKSKVDEAAAHAYNEFDDSIHLAGERLENAFS